MKYKMAPNSLFSVLLRSPWWISLVLAATLLLVARTAFPPEYFLFGAMSALPFIVIAVVAGRRQWNVPSDARTESTLKAVGALTWRDFASAVEAAYARDGFTVTRLPGPAADFAALRDGRTTLVSCKRWKAANVGLEALRDLASAQQKQDASASQLITLGALSEPAEKFARERGIAVVHGPALAHLMRSVKIA